MYVSGDIFTTEPKTQYVWINEIATFECAIINGTGYTLGFSLIPASVTCGEGSTVIDLPEGGRQATCSFTVTSDNSGTKVRCYADDRVEPIFTNTTFAYAQGKW